MNSNRLYVSVFIILISLGFILTLSTPDKVFSALENRNLQTFPVFTVDKIMNGKYMREFEDYANDQFIFRDYWVKLKTLSEKVLGKEENNGVYFAKDEYLIEKFDKVNQEQIDKNINQINKFTERLNLNSNILLIPTQAAILSDKLPKYAPNVDQSLILKNIQNQLISTINYIDAYSSLIDHNDEYIYYKTDHHWTSLGAYYAYESFVNSIGLNPLSYEELKPEVVSNNFYGTMYSQASASWIKPDIMHSFKNDNIIDFYIKDQDKTYDSVYFNDFLDKKDKYSFFLGGNYGYSKINTNAPSGKILIIKDSYANSLIPILAHHYKEIHIVDFRYQSGNIDELIENNGIKDVLFLYNLSTFNKDNNLIWLNYNKNN